MFMEHSRNELLTAATHCIKERRFMVLLNTSTGPGTDVPINNRAPFEKAFREQQEASEWPSSETVCVCVRDRRVSQVCERQVCVRDRCVCETGLCVRDRCVCETGVCVRQVCV